MILIVTGGRDFVERQSLRWALDVLHQRHHITFMSLGDAKGADAIALEWAKSKGIHGVMHRAKWDKLGKGAGHERNGRMIATALARSVETGEPVKVLAAPGSRGTGPGTGTGDCIGQARAKGIIVEDMDALLNDEIGDWDDSDDFQPRDWGSL